MVTGLRKVIAQFMRQKDPAHDDDTAVGCCDNHHICVVRHLRPYYLYRYPLLALKNFYGAVL